MTVEEMIRDREKLTQLTRESSGTEMEKLGLIADTLKAEARRSSQVKQAGYQAEVDQAAARAEQAGPLSDAHARQEVAEADRVRLQAGADAEQVRLDAAARAESTRAMGHGRGRGHPGPGRCADGRSDDEKVATA